MILIAELMSPGCKPIPHLPDEAHRAKTDGMYVLSSISIGRSTQQGHRYSKSCVMRCFDATQSEHMDEGADGGSNCAPAKTGNYMASSLFSYAEYKKLNSRIK